MNRLTMSGTALVLAATVLTGGTLVSVALAATTATHARPTTAAAVAGVSDAELRAARAVAVPAAADALDLSTRELRDRLHAGRSLKQIADARGIGYGIIARAVKEATAAEVDAELGGRRAEQVAAVVAGWIDAGGQPDAELLAGEGND